MLKKDYIHPYKHNEVDNFRFSYDLLGIDNYKIKTISNHENCINTLDFFHINDVYQAHTFEIDRILKLKRAFNGTYLSMLESHLLDGIISKTEMLRILFGTELVEEKYLDMPLSKFKHDIFKELELVER